MKEKIIGVKNKTMKTTMVNTNLPVIITRGIIIFPEGQLSLEIGRLKSLNALTVAQENYQGQVIVVSQKSPKENNPLLGNIYEVGTLCNIQSEKKYKEHSMANLKGVRRVYLKKVIDNDEYYSVEFESFESETFTKVANNKLIKKINENLQMMLGTHGSITNSVIKNVLSRNNAGEIIDLLAHHFPYLTLEKRQQLLEEKSIQER
jgi:ATP-dependent Lon protease